MKAKYRTTHTLLLRNKKFGCSLPTCNFAAEFNFCFASEKHAVKKHAASRFRYPNLRNLNPNRFLPVRLTPTKLCTSKQTFTSE